MERAIYCRIGTRKQVSGLRESSEDVEFCDFEKLEKLVNELPDFLVSGISDSYEIHGQVAAYSSLFTTASRIFCSRD
jgi:hypothetical protein